MDFDEVIPSPLKRSLIKSILLDNEEYFHTLSEGLFLYDYEETQNEFDDLMMNLIVSAVAVSENTHFIVPILDLFKKLNPGILPSAHTYLFMLPYQRILSTTDEIKPLLEKIFLYLANQEEEDKDEKHKVDQVEILKQLVKLDHPETSIFIERLFEVFPKKLWVRDGLKEILEEADKKSSHGFETLFNIFVEMSPYAPIPKWVRNFVYDPTEYPLDTEWFYSCKEKSLYDEEVQAEAIKKSVPFWVVEEDFEYEAEDEQSIYSMVTYQDTPLGFFIDEEEFDFDVKENQIPFWDDLGIPDYPKTKYSTEKVLGVLPSYWEDTWDEIERNVAQSGEDIKIETEPEEEMDFLRNRVLSLNLYDLEILFKDYLGKIPEEAKRTDIYYFRIYGPRNAIPTDENEEGGERMLLSNVYDYDEDEEEEYEWFLGHCLSCALRIRRKQHALRLPVPGGGWRGCYCSPECATKAIEEYDLMTPRLLEVVVDDLYAIGIQDFLPEPDEEEE